MAGRWGELLLEVGLPPTYPSQTGAAACRLSYVAHRTPCAEKAAPASDLENESVMLRLEVLTAIAAELQSVSEQAADADEECVFELATRCADAAESAAETARAARNVDVDRDGDGDCGGNNDVTTETTARAPSTPIRTLTPTPAPSSSSSSYSSSSCGKENINVTAAAAAAGTGTAGTVVLLKQVFFWTHHTRRKQLLIYEWAKELRIGGR